MFDLSKAPCEPSQGGIEYLGDVLEVVLLSRRGIVNRPFEGGSLMRRLHRRPLPQWAAEFDTQSWGELLLRWVVSHPAVTCVIPATGDPDHLRENMRAGEGTILPEKERARLRELLLSA